MKTREGEHPFGDRGQMIAFVLFLLTWSIDSFYLHFLPGIKTDLPFVVRISAFFVLLVLSYVLMKDGHRVLNDPSKVSRLITDGAFRISRHPIYLSILIFYFALSVLTASILALMLLIFIFFYYDFLARYEEKYLYIKFGKAYLTYREETSKWVSFRRTAKS